MGGGGKSKGGGGGSRNNDFAPPGRGGRNQDSGRGNYDSGGRNYESGGGGGRNYEDPVDPYHTRRHSRVANESDVKAVAGPIFEQQGRAELLGKFVSSLETRGETLAVVDEHGGVDCAACGYCIMQDLLQGRKEYSEYAVPEDPTLWTAIEKIGYSLRDERMRNIDLELCTRLYKRGEYLPHYIYLSQFPNYNPAMVERRGPGADLPAVLMVAEKPSIAKVIAEHLSGGRYRTRRGVSRACQTYEFVCHFAPARGRCRLIVTSVIGHVFGLTFKKQKGLRPEWMFAAEVSKEIEEGSRKMRVPEHLSELASECEYLALWLDCDREGENICYEVISIVREHFPTDQNIYRAHFSAITEPEIKRAYGDLQRPNKYMAMAVDARQELDLKVGISFSTLLKWNFLEAARAKFPRMDLKMLTYGPCQTPTLWFCVERHREIQKFRRDQWYKPTFSLRVPHNGSGRDPSAMLKFQTELLWTWPHALDNIISSGGRGGGRGKGGGRGTKGAQARGRIINYRSEQKVLKRPVGLNTVAMLKAASSLGYSPGTAMKVAEDLYSAGFISYPRTESTKYADSYNVTEVLEEQTNNPQWGKTVAVFLRQNDHWIEPPSEGYDAGDHPPITPCGRLANRDDMKKGSQWKLYEFICRHFLATVMGDCHYTEHTITASLSDGSSSGSSNRNQIRGAGAGANIQGGQQAPPLECVVHTFEDRGFLFATPWKGENFNDLAKQDGAGRGGRGGFDNVSARQIQGLLPRGDFDISDLKVEEGSTEPPQYLKESELVALMDKHGIGTDASMAGHIDNVVARNYCKVHGPCLDGSGKPGDAISNKGKGKGKTKGGERPTSRHMVPTGLGLAILDMLERIVPDVVEPKVRSFMEKQCAQISNGVASKEQVVAENLQIFESRFTEFKERMEEVRHILGGKAPPGNSNSGGGGGRDRGGNQYGGGGRGGQDNYGGGSRGQQSGRGGQDHGRNAGGNQRQQEQNYDFESDIRTMREYGYNDRVRDAWDEQDDWGEDW
ncbi:unnamed protein product [Amoebophrya sp. A25]|nr:unnamed protein product [Amoebophrya sp. A25]|eukprot:GSA25T00023069001.1